MKLQNRTVTNKSIISEFIEVIWNENQLDKIDGYLTNDYEDHSLLPSLPPNKEGTLIWINATGKSFKHKTIIDDMVCEDDKVVLKITMRLKHIGVWRNIHPTQLEFSVGGFRYYKLKDGKIKAHWALIDGNAIEHHLKDKNSSCNVPHKR